MWGFVHLLNSFWDSTAYLIYNVICMYSPQMYAMMTWHYSSFCVKFIKWDFSHGSLYFCCTDESINFQKIILFQSWKFITIINQFFCGLINKYCCLLLSLSWHMRRKKKHYQHGLQREKRRVWSNPGSTTTLLKRFKNVFGMLGKHFIKRCYNVILCGFLTLS